MSIIRVHKEDNFSIIANTCFNDARLCFKSVGLLCYLLSKPNNWTVQPQHLATTHTDGITAIYSAISELEGAGYIRRARVRDAGGQIIRVDYEVFETPKAAIASENDQAENESPPENPFMENLNMGNLNMGNPNVGDPNVGNPVLLNTELTKDGEEPSTSLSGVLKKPVSTSQEDSIAGAARLKKKTGRGSTPTAPAPPSPPQSKTLPNGEPWPRSKDNKRNLSPGEVMLKLYAEQYDLTDETSERYLFRTYTPGVTAAKKIFADLLAQGVTLDLFAYWLVDVELFPDYLFDLRKNGYPTLWTLAAAVRNNRVLTQRLIRDLAPRTLPDGSTVPSPWRPEYYGEDAKYMTRERLLMLRRQGKNNPQQWWRDNRHVYDKSSRFVFEDHSHDPHFVYMG